MLTQSHISQCHTCENRLLSFHYSYSTQDPLNPYLIPISIDTRDCLFIVFIGVHVISYYTIKIHVFLLFDFEKQKFLL